MAVKKSDLPVTPRKIVMEPVWGPSGLQQVRVSYTAQATHALGSVDIGMVSVTIPASDMTAEEQATYALLASRFDELAVAELGCEAVQNG